MTKREFYEFLKDQGVKKTNSISCCGTDITKFLIFRNSHELIMWFLSVVSKNKLIVCKTTLIACKTTLIMCKTTLIVCKTRYICKCCCELQMMSKDRRIRVCNSLSVDFTVSFTVVPSLLSGGGFDCITYVQLSLRVFLFCWPSLHFLDVAFC